MIGPENAWIVYFVLACAIAWLGWITCTIGPIHHCDECKHWWEAQQGAKIMGGVIVFLDKDDMVTVKMGTGETAKCSLQMLRDLYTKSQVSAHA